MVLLTEHLLIFDAHADYDVLLLDAVLWPAAILTELLKVPVVDVLSMGPFQPGSAALWSSPNPVAYLPQISSGLTPGMVSSACLSHALLATKHAQVPVLRPQSVRTCMSPDPQSCPYTFTYSFELKQTSRAQNVH